MTLGDLQDYPHAIEDADRKEELEKEGQRWRYRFISTGVIVLVIASFIILGVAAEQCKMSDQSTVEALMKIL